MVSVLIVDDNPTFRGAAEAVLSSVFEIVGTAEDGEQAVEMADKLGPDLVVMDIAMPGIDGIEATRRVRATNSDVDVVLVSTMTREELPDGALTCGALGFIPKDELTSQRLIDLYRDAGADCGPSAKF
jgi:two-component system invasion response regulator UvrY